jgi:hypothetical protein
MAPTAAEVESEPATAPVKAAVSPETISAILKEVRAIRQSLEKA